MYRVFFWCWIYCSRERNRSFCFCGVYRLMLQEFMKLFKEIKGVLRIKKVEVINLGYINIEGRWVKELLREFEFILGKFRDLIGCK